MSCEVTMFLNSEMSITTDYMKDKLESVTDKIIKNNFESNKSFNFNKKKI